MPKRAAAQRQSTTVTNTIRLGPRANGGQFSMQLGQVNTPAMATLTCDPSTLPPKLGQWALVLFSGLLAGDLWLQRSKRCV